MQERNKDTKADNDIALNCPITGIEYDACIETYLRQREWQTRLRENYLQTQECTASIRAALIDWLIQRQVELKLKSATLHLAVDIVDRFLSRVRTVSDQLLLLSLTALFIAAKYEEVYYPKLKKFAATVESIYDIVDILKMECMILTTLSFDISIVTSLTFLDRYSIDLASPYYHLALYLLETFLLDPSMHKYMPSLRAAASLYVAGKVILEKTDNGNNPVVWSRQQATMTQYPESEVAICAQEILRAAITFSRSRYRALKLKYSSPNFHAVSHIQLRLPFDFLV